VFELKFETANEAFTFPEDEVARILREVAKQAERGETSGRVRDHNGNRVGFWQLA